jgi:hypothetical protein
MKRILLTLAAAAISLFAANAEEKTKTYDFGDIVGISAGGSYQVHVTEGNSNKVKVVYDSDIEEYLKLEVRYFSGSLILRTEPKTSKAWHKDYKIHVYLEMSTINQIELSGAAKVEFSGKYKSNNLEIDLSGASKMNELVIDGQTLEVELSGASQAELTGNFSGNAEVNLSGASNFTWKGNAASLESDLSGASKFESKGNFKKCEIGCSGASNAEFAGNVENAEYECSGASRVNARDFVAKTASVELTGASKAEINASEDLYYDISRSSKITYYGDAKLHNRNPDTNVVRGR